MKSDLGSLIVGASYRVAFGRSRAFYASVIFSALIGLVSGALTSFRVGGAN